MISTKSDTGLVYIGQELFSRYWRTIQLLILIMLGITLYANSLNVPFTLDDSGLIGIDTSNILNILTHGKSRRVVDFTFAINHLLHGSWPYGFHVVNTAIHISATLALYFLTATMLDATTPPATATAEQRFRSRFVPFAVALLFVSHPLQTQAVTYIIQRYTSLATLFYLLAVLAFVRLRLPTAHSYSVVRRATLICIIIICGILAFGSKQIAITLPITLLLIEAVMFRGRALNKRFYQTCAALMLVVICAAALHWHNSSWHDFLFDLNQLTSEDPLSSRTTYALTQTRVVVRYLGLLFFPIGQSLFHDFSLSRTLFSLPVLAALSLHILLICSACLLIAAARKPQLQKHAPLLQMAALGILWFYVTLAVESSFIPIRDIAFEHRLYLPSAGIFMTTACLLALLCQYRRRTSAWFILTLTIITLGSLTIARNRVWQSPLALWRDTVAKAPTNGLAVANLGGVYISLNQPEKALPLYVQAVRLNARFQVFHVGEALKLLGMDPARFTSGKEILFPGGKASPYMNPALQKKYEVAAHNALGLGYEHLGDLNSARQCYEHSINLDPDYDKAWYNLALLAKKSGDTALANLAVQKLASLHSPLATSLAAQLSR